MLITLNVKVLEIAMLYSIKAKKLMSKGPSTRASTFREDLKVSFTHAKDFRVNLICPCTTARYFRESFAYKICFF